MEARIPDYPRTRFGRTMVAAQVWPHRFVHEGGGAAPDVLRKGEKQ
jgi:hypothetical protein